MDHTHQQSDSSPLEAASLEDCRHSGPDVEQCAERLAVLTQRLMNFVHGQADRMQDVSREMEAAASQQAELERLSHELEQQKADWEQQQAREAKHIAEETRMLTDAWDRIEEERRERLTTGSVAQPVEVASTAPLAVEQTGRSLSGTDLFDLGIPTSTQSAAVQFQQIKREIRQHARRQQ